MFYYVSVIAAGIFICPTGVAMHAGSSALTVFMWIMAGVHNLIGNQNNRHENNRNVYRSKYLKFVTCAGCEKTKSNDCHC